jgi:hypothetical protein
VASQDDGSWSGRGTLDGVKGRLTITGAPDPSTDAVEFESKVGFHKHRGGPLSSQSKAIAPELVDGRCGGGLVVACMSENAGG